MVELDFDTVLLPFVQILSDDCKVVTETQCYNISEAQIKRNKALGSGKIAIITMKRVIWEDSIPF